MRKYLWIILLIGIVSGFLVGTYIYKQSIEEDKKIAFEPVDDECTIEADLEETGILDLKRVNSSEEKTSPNTIITTKILYKKCNHLKINSQKIDKESVNLNEEEFKKICPEWKVQKFTSKEVVLYQETEDFCNEHYLLKEANGYIEIYALDENDEINYLFQTTDIATEYLTEIDKGNLQKGIKIYTNKELNKVLEDFE